MELLLPPLRSPVALAFTECFIGEQMKYDEVVILCFRTTNPNVLIVDGARKTICEICRHDVWIAPSSLRMKAKMKAKVVCDVCEKLKPKPGEIIEIAPLNKDQVGEIKDALENRKHRN